MHHRLLLVGIGVQVAAHVLHAVQDVPGLPPGGSFENQVLHEVRHALLVLAFVARAGIDGKAAVRDRESLRLVHQPQAVGQRMLVELRHSCLFFAAKLTTNPVPGNIRHGIATAGYRVPPSSSSRMTFA